MQFVRQHLPLTRSLLTLSACIGLLLFGSACSKDSGSGSAAATLATPRQLSKSKNGTKMISPVSGKEIVKSSATPALVWDNKLYMFCCDTDRQKFRDNPSVFASEVLPPNALILE